MKYLLDTSVVVNFFRGKKLISETVLKSGAAISIITQAELFYGAIKSASSPRNLEIIKGFLRDLEIKVINLDEQIIFSFARQKAALEKQGRRLDDFDLLIAATAIKNNLILVTGNTRHFGRIRGLRLA